MSALTLPALGLTATATGVRTNRYRLRDAGHQPRDASSPSRTRRHQAALWVLAGAAVATLHATGASFGPLVPSPMQFALAYVAVVVALNAAEVAVERFALRGGTATNPILAADSGLNRVFFLGAFVPHVVLWFALPAVALPDAPLAASALTVAALAVPHLPRGVPRAVVRGGRAVVCVGAFRAVVATPGAGVATAAVALAGAYFVYALKGLVGHWMQP